MNQQKQLQQIYWAFMNEFKKGDTVDLITPFSNFVGKGPYVIIGKNDTHYILCNHGNRTFHYCIQEATNDLILIQKANEVEYLKEGF